MSKSFLFFAALLCCAGAVEAQVVVFGDDYAAGLSFTAFGGSNNSLTIDAADARSGSAGTKSLKVAVPGAWHTGAMDAVSHHHTTAFHAISFRVEAGKVATLHVAFPGNNAGSSHLASELSEPIANNTDWKSVMIPVPDPAKLTAFNGWWHFAEGAYTIRVVDIQYENIDDGIIGASTLASMNSQTLNLAIGVTFTPQQIRATSPVNAGRQTGNGV